MTPINGALPLTPPLSASEAIIERRAPSIEQTPEAPFSALLEQALASANTQAQSAHSAAQAFAAGSRDDIHGTMLALSKADIELRVVGNVRNKIIDAFYELWRMQV